MQPRPSKRERTSSYQENSPKNFNPRSINISMKGGEHYCCLTVTVRFSFPIPLVMSHAKLIKGINGSEARLYGINI